MAEKTSAPKLHEAEKPTKPKRKMSSGLQMMAKIERMMDEVDIATYNRVLAWIKTLPTKEPTNA